MKHQQQLKYSSILIIVFILAGSLLTACGGKQDKTYTIGIINISPNQESTIKAFKEGMTELGYVEGENVTYIYDGPVATDKLDELAQNLVKAKVDLILSITTRPTQAAQKATAGTDIPVVFIPVTNPVEAGIVNSLTKPGGNITGVTGTAEGKRLEWLVQIVPTIKQVYIVYNPNDPSPVQAIKTVSETATRLGVELILREASTIEEAMSAFNDIPQEVDAIFFPPDSVVNARIVDVLKIANEHKLPTSGPSLPALNDGALTVYGMDLAASAKKQTARLAHQILQGIKPADLPVETAEFSAGINLKTAQAIGIDIPDTILRQANTIIR
jgi:putative tryptophan/tyrosine transport system substrate-binding protein